MVTLFQTLYTVSYVTAGRVSDRVRSLKEERGASAVEYALLVGLIAAAVVAAVALFGPKLNTLFTNVNVSPAAPTTAGAGG